MKLNKKLMLLIVLVMMSLNAFSQNVIDSTKIQLTKPIAKLVIKDLLKGDGLSTEIKTMQLLLTETNNKFLSQSDLVFNLQTQITNFESVNKQLTFKFEAQERLSKELETSLRRQKNKTKLYKIGTYIGVAAVGILIVK
jgi:ribosome-associated translation inhibitor RaiA